MQARLVSADLLNPSHSYSPQIALISVVLPAPFGPTSPIMVPEFILRLIECIPAPSRLAHGFQVEKSRT
tara:strand:+ start:3656 stop:3862 length:207 start_codon:yes stop_codon:yes gene_type:complete